jgi:hypothetical protein
MLRATDPERRRGPGTLVGTVVLVPALVALALVAFAWPSARLAPRDLPIGVAGPPQAATAIQRQLAQRGGAFDVHVYADEAAARAAIGDREVYGAIVAAPNGVTLLTASAASPVVAQLLSQAATEAGPAGGPASGPAGDPAGGPAGTLAGSTPGGPATSAPATSAPGASAPGASAPGGRQPRVVDVVPADPEDPRGAALSASVLPLVLAGMLTAVLIGAARRRGLGRVAALVVAAALAGLVAVGIAQSWLGVIGGDWWVNAGVLGLTVLAIAAGAAGLLALVGEAGLVLAALVMVLLGNPLSGVPSAPELLPQPFGTIGQLLPPGAGGSLLRSTAFFDGNAAGGPLTVLAVWAVLGLAAVWAGGRRRRRPAATSAVVRPLTPGGHGGSSAAS